MTDICDADFLTIGLLRGGDAAHPGGREPTYDLGYRRQPVRLRWDPASFDEVYVNADSIVFPQTILDWGRVTGLQIFAGHYPLVTVPFEGGCVYRNETYCIPARTVKLARSALLERFHDRRIAVLSMEEPDGLFAPRDGREYMGKIAREYVLEWPHRPRPLDPYFEQIDERRLLERLDAAARHKREIEARDALGSMFKQKYGSWTDPPAEDVASYKKWFAERERRAMEGVRTGDFSWFEAVRPVERDPEGWSAAPQGGFNYRRGGMEAWHAPVEETTPPIQPRDRRIDCPRPSERKIIVPVPRLWGQLDQALNAPKKPELSKTMPDVEPTPAGAEELIDWARAHEDKAAWADKLSIPKVTRFMKERSSFGKGWTESDLVALAT